MPLYEYECPTCKAMVESFITDPTDKVECEECGSEMKKLMSAGSFRIYGEGVYKPNKKEMN
jgi:putative FmdB family regulatory protein